MLHEEASQGMSEKKLFSNGQILGRASPFLQANYYRGCSSS